MALIQVTTIQRFIGVNADVATLPTSGVLPGSKFTAIDTGVRYVFDGTAWAEDLTDVITDG